ncbi:DUF456 domain-containing protein, partial [Patescibacteria group bacterium]|nr:DUF456 domain-containing protein [Patescibacteria group bacterium]
MDFSQAFFATACGVIMVIGLLGIIFPFFPGIILMWVAFSLYAGVTQFEVIRLDHILIISLLTFAAFVLEYVSRYWGAHKYNASKWGFVGAILGGIIGSMFGWLPALLIGPFIGAVIGEVYSGRDEAFKIKFKSYTLIGFVG